MWETILLILFVVVFLPVLMLLPIWFIYCWRPGKSLKEGLRDWINESDDDM